MDRSAFEFDILNSPHAASDDDMLRLVDQWVQRFDRSPDVLDAPSAHPVGSPPAPRSERSRSPLETMRTDWSRLARGTSGKKLPTDHHRTWLRPRTNCCRSSRQASSPPSPTASADISLSHVDRRLQHRGTVAVRSRGTAVDVACRDIGLPDQVARAFEFVAPGSASRSTP